jgi:hypothetical protein
MRSNALWWVKGVITRVANGSAHDEAERYLGGRERRARAIDQAGAAAIGSFKLAG